MKDYRFTPLFIFIILYGTGQSTNTDDLKCVNDYETTVTCVWRNSDFSGHQCYLAGTSYESSVNCELRPSSDRSPSTRSCILTFGSGHFHFKNKINVTVNCNGSVVSELSGFQLGHHIKLQPPEMPVVEEDNIMWNNSKNFPKKVEEYEFQLQFKDAHTNWEKSRHRNTSQSSIARLDPSLLTIGEQYQARVRVKPVKPMNDGWLRGEWSDWSPAVSWTSKIGKSPIDPDDDTSSVSDMHVVLIIGFHILLVLAALSVVIYKSRKSSQLLKPKHQHVPDPSKYFQPLHTVHGGNFRRWLGCQNSAGPFLTPQSCDDISPVEVSAIWDESLMDAQTASGALLHGHQVDSGLDNSGSSSSGGFSNMGYFYSKSNTGSLYLESCPVYFSYHPDEGTGSTLSSHGSSCNSLPITGFHTEEPLSPDSGFGMPEAELSIDEGAEKTVAEGYALVSFILSLSQGFVRPPVADSAPVAVVAPWPEPVRADSCASVCEPAEGAAVRPSSMIEPCGGGYLTLKEMQKYSNKSI